MRSRLRTRSGRLTASTLAGLSMLTACATQPTVEAERSDAIAVPGEMVGVPNLSELPSASDPVATLPPLDDFPTIETIPPLAEPMDEWVEPMDEWIDTMDDWIEPTEDSDDPMPTLPDSVPTLPELYDASRLLELQIDQGVLADPWEVLSGPALTAGHTEREYQTDCDPASRIMDLAQHDHSTIEWRLSNGSALLQSTVYAMVDFTKVETALAEIDSLDVVCPSFTWVRTGLTDTVSDLPDTPAGVASMTRRAETGEESHFAALESGRFLIVVDTYLWNNDEATRVEASAAFNLVVHEMVRLTAE